MCEQEGSSDESYVEEGGGSGDEAEAEEAEESSYSGGEEEEDSDGDEEEEDEGGEGGGGGGRRKKKKLRVSRRETAKAAKATISAVIAAGTHAADQSAERAAPAGPNQYSAEALRAEVWTELGHTP